MTNEVATAAERTLASGTARVWHQLFLHPPAPRLERFVMTEEGVTDLTRRRTRTELEPLAQLDEWAVRLLARYPWLDDDEDEDHERSRPAIVYAGGARFLNIGGRWIAGDDGKATRSERRPMDPLWIVEVLAHADEAVARGDDVARGAACRQWEFRVDPALHPEIRARTGDSKRRPLRLAGDAWIDHDGRLRRVIWTRLPRRRSRWPKKTSPGPRAWQTTELWDFGVAVEIEVPIIEPEPSRPWPVALMELAGSAGSLWRRKRAYERRHRGREGLPLSPP